MKKIFPVNKDIKPVLNRLSKLAPHESGIPENIIGDSKELIMEFCPNVKEFKELDRRICGNVLLAFPEGQWLFMYVLALAEGWTQEIKGNYIVSFNFKTKQKHVFELVVLIDQKGGRVELDVRVQDGEHYYFVNNGVDFVKMYHQTKKKLQIDGKENFPSLIFDSLSFSQVQDTVLPFLYGNTEKIWDNMTQTKVIDDD